MIELIIKIPESEIPKQQDIIEIPLHFIDGKVCEAGGYEFDVLPKGHGDLIDRDTILQGEHFIIQGNLTAGERDFGAHEFDMFTRQAIMSVKPVIEADKESEK